MSALLPILIAVVVRFLFGGSRITNTMVTVATVWFTVNVLAAPTWVVLAVVGALLILIGRKKKRLIGYARD